MGARGTRRRRVARCSCALVGRAGAPGSATGYPESSGAVVASWYSSGHSAWFSRCGDCAMTCSALTVVWISCATALAKLVTSALRPRILLFANRLGVVEGQSGRQQQQRHDPQPIEPYEVLLDRDSGRAGLAHDESKGTSKRGSSGWAIGLDGAFALHSLYRHPTEIERGPSKFVMSGPRFARNVGQFVFAERLLVKNRAGCYSFWQ